MQLLVWLVGCLCVTKSIGGSVWHACWCDLCRPQFETRAECLFQHGDVINP